MKPKPKGFLGPVIRHLAPATMLPTLDSPYRRLTNGASGKYDGAVVKVTGTTIGFSGSGEPGGRQFPVNAVQGSVAVANTIPGKMLPTGEPTPGKVPAGPKFDWLPNGGPKVALNPGKPKLVPISPGPIPKFGATPPVNGYATFGCPKDV